MVTIIMYALDRVSVLVTALVIVRQAGKETDAFTFPGKSYFDKMLGYAWDQRAKVVDRSAEVSRVSFPASAALQ